jgi:LDH2 family malate/lactate/ureidoglycolate dehydrogenase
MPKKTDLTIPFSDLVRRVRGAAEALGFSPADAGQVAMVIADADLHGTHSHGVRLFVSHLPQLREGAIAVNARPVLAVDNGVAGVIDGGHGYGPVVCSFATSLAVARARLHGIAAFAVRHSSHWGCPSFYARLVTEAGLVLFAASNTGVAMPLWGTAEKSVGNNPVVFGVPRLDGDPWILDISMQRAAWGKLAVYRDSGLKLPGEWGLDAENCPTDDPAAIIASGLIYPMGEHKGSGLAVILEALTGGLAASLHSHEIRERLDRGQTQHKSQFFLVLDPVAFGGRAGLQRLVASFATASARARRPDGGEPFRLPGKGTADKRLRHLKYGIPLTPTLRMAIATLEAELGA